MDVIARFPARPDSAPPEPPPPLAPPARAVPPRADRGPKRPAKPTRKPPDRQRERQEKSLFPARSVVALAVVAAGIWGLALRNELVHRGDASVELAETEPRASHRVASEPGSQSATDARIAE